MTMTELADLILARMYDLAQKQGYSEDFDINAIAQEFGETDTHKVSNAARVLEGHGWIDATFEYGGGIHAFLTGPGSIAVEQGGTTGVIHAFRQNPRRFLVVDRSTHYHGPITGQNIAINAQVGSQSATFSTLSPDVVALMDRIITELKQATELAEDDRREYLDDIQRLRSELQRRTPRVVIVSSILETLGNVATIHPWVKQLWALFPK